MPKHLESCLAEIAQFRANLNMLEEALRQDWQQLWALRRRQVDPRQPEYQEHIQRMEDLAEHLARNQALLSRALPELEALLRQCRESEARAPDREGDAATLETSLRKTIDDPRYWRDGDPALAQSVSDGFKQLYPDD